MRKFFLLSRGEDVYSSKLALLTSKSVVAYVREMLAGVPAFRSADPAEVYRKILVEAPRLLFKSSAECDALLAGLLAKAPEQRLCAADEVCDAPFFAAIAWSSLRSRSTPAPFRPKIAHPTDTSNVVTIEKYASPASEEGDGAE